MAIKLVSAADVRTYLNFTSTNQDALINDLIEQVSETFRIIAIVYLLGLQVQLNILKADLRYYH